VRPPAADGASPAAAGGASAGRALLDALPAALAEIAPDGRVLHANARFLELVGQEAPDGQLVLERLLHPEDRAEHARALSALLAGEGAYRRDERYLRHDGTVVWATNEIALEGPHGGEPRVLLAANASAAQLSRVEVARERTLSEVRRRDEFLGRLSHELRSPLAAILVWARLLRDDGNEAVDVGRGLEVIERSGRSLERILDDLAQVARISSGRLQLQNRCPLDLRAVASAAADGVMADAAAREVSLERVLPASATVVDGEAPRLQQAVTHLLTNAVKFTPAGGRVELRVEGRGDEALVVVRDTGEGMAPEVQAGLFERFGPLESGARTIRGLGVGLYIVRHIVELHGGRVSAASEGPGSGSAFTISLPLAAPAGKERLTQPDGELPAGLRVLVVDDDDDTREALRLILQQSALVIETASSAAEAMAKLRASPPDLLLSDVAMPSEDGLSLIRRIRALPAAQGGRLPAAALTAYASPPEREAALRAGFDWHVAKPVDPPELLRVIARLARRRR
jgi:PAS domain S-box-containing protein